MVPLWRWPSPETSHKLKHSPMIWKSGFLRIRAFGSVTCQFCAIHALFGALYPIYVRGEADVEEFSGTPEHLLKLYPAIYTGTAGS